MKPQDLFEEAQRHLSPETNSVVGNSERVRLMMAETLLCGQAADILDRVFKQFDTLDQGPVRVGDNVWLGKPTVTELIDSENNKKEVTRRWVRLEMPTDDSFSKLAPDGFVVRKRLLMGTIDWCCWNNDELRWNQSTRGLSLDVLTTLFVEPKNETAQADPEKDVEVIDPFEHGPIRLERINDGLPVFIDSDEVFIIGFRKLPPPHTYPSRDVLYESVRATIDDFYAALTQAAA